MKVAFDRAMVWMVDHRRFTFSLIVLTTVLSLIGHLRPDWVRSFFVTSATANTASGNSTESVEEVRKAPDVGGVFEIGGESIVVVRSKQFFTPVGTKMMRHVVERLEEQDFVAGVLWMDRVPMLNIFGLREPLFPRSEASSQRFAAAREKAMAHPLVKGQLLSEDGETLLLMVSIDADFVRSDDHYTAELRRICETAAKDFPEVEASFRVTGPVPAWLTAMQAHEANQMKYQVIGYGVIAVMAIVLFRGFRAVFIVSLAPVTGVFWTLGFLKFFNLQDNPFNDVVLPVLVSLAGLTDGVHLMVLLRKLRASGMSEREASRESLQQVGFACMLTSLTTAIGMGSLVLSHNRWVQEFGWCSVIGVTLTFFAVAWIIPLVCSTWFGRDIHKGIEKSLIDRNLSKVSVLIDWVLRYPKFISMAGIVSTLLMTGVSLTLRPDERRSNALPEQSETYQALNHLDKTLGGLEPADVLIAWTSRVPDDSAEILETITEVNELLKNERDIGYPLSIRNLVDALPGAGPTEERVTMLELLPPQLKRAYYRPEFRTASVRFRVQDLGIAKYGPVFERLETGLAQIHQRHPNFTLKLDGDAVWRWRNLYQIVVDLASSLGSAAIIIFIVLGLSYRSVPLGLIAVIPNVFPLALAGVWMVFSGYALELVSVCAFTVCIGIVVDDTIHFMTRFVEERELTSDVDTAIRRAFGNAGVAMIMTTAVLVAGFGTVAFSDSRDHHIFATMCVLTIAAALFGDVVLLPAMLSRYAPRDRDTKTKKS